MKSLLTKLAQLKLNAVKEPWVQLVHAGIGFALTLFLRIWLNKYLAGVPVLALAGGLEFWFDPTYEGQDFTSNFHDFGFYVLGVFGAWLIF